MAVDLEALRVHVERLRYVKEHKAVLNSIEAESKAAIQEALGDDDAGTIDGETVVTWKVHKKSALDQKLLAKMHPGPAMECRKVTVARRFEVVE